MPEFTNTKVSAQLKNAIKKETVTLNVLCSPAVIRAAVHFKVVEIGLASHGFCGCTRRDDSGFEYSVRVVAVVGVTQHKMEDLLRLAPIHPA